MVSSDTVVGIVGAVILTGAMIAVFYYENTGVGAGDADLGEGANVFTYRFERVNVTAPESGDKASIGIGAPTNNVFQVPAYAYAVFVELTWTDRDTLPAALNSGPDTFTLKLLNNTGGAADEDPTGNSPQNVEHVHEDPATTPPATITVAAADSAAANATLAEDLATRHGAGTWTAVVTLDATGDATGQRDAGNDYTLTITYSYWRAVLED